MKFAIRHLATAAIVGFSSWLFPLSAHVSIDSIVSFADSRQEAPASICARQAREWCKSIPKQELLQYVQKTEKALYTPKCPPCNRGIYATLVAALLQSGKDETMLMRYRYQYNILSHNNEGEEATDFVFLDTESHERRLLQTSTPFTLLIFNDPECDECAMLRKLLLASRPLATAIRNGSLSVIAIYPYQASDDWLKQMKHYPPQWIKGYAEDVSDLYDLRTLPTTYLLGHDLTVILRDGSIQELEAKITPARPKKNR